MNSLKIYNTLSREKEEFIPLNFLTSRNSKIKFVWSDGRTDERQLGMSYEDLEKAMLDSKDIQKTYKKHTKNILYIFWSMWLQS